MILCAVPPTFGHGSARELHPVGYRYGFKEINAPWAVDGGEQWSRSTCRFLAGTHSLAGRDEHSFALLSKNWLGIKDSNLN